MHYDYVADYEKCRCGQNEYYDTTILKCVSNGKCGNGVLDEDEACDDGNAKDGYGWCCYYYMEKIGN